MSDRGCGGLVRVQSEKLPSVGKVGPEPVENIMINYVKCSVKVQKDKNRYQQTGAGRLRLGGGQSLCCDVMWRLGSQQV